MHLGNAWTALLAWLSARSQGGAMVLRMEDLDPDRSKPHFARAIVSDLAWLGLDWDEGPDTSGPHGPYTQSERHGLYESRLRELDARGLLYPCFCTRAELRAVTQAPHAGEGEPVYPGTCRALTEPQRARRLAAGRRPAQRVRVDDVDIGFTDAVAGCHAQNMAAGCGDFVLRRADGAFAYQLAVTCDDAAQGITEVVRGADLLDSTPRQIWLMRLFGWPEPTYAHVPLLVDETGRRLSKRRQDVDLGALRDQGVAPETVTGYLAFKAGLLESPRPAAPWELVEGFTLRALPPGAVVVEEGWLERV